MNPKMNAALPSASPYIVLLKDLTPCALAELRAQFPGEWVDGEPDGSWVIPIFCVRYDGSRTLVMRVYTRSVRTIPEIGAFLDRINSQAA